MTARTPEDLHTVLATACSLGDIDAFARAYEKDATLIVPPDGSIAHGRAQIRSAVAALFTGNHVMRSDVVKKIESGGPALTHAPWEFNGTDAAGNPVSLAGRGTMVSRRQPDGIWLIVLDNPMSPD